MSALDLSVAFLPGVALMVIDVIGLLTKRRVGRSGMKAEARCVDKKWRGSLTRSSYRFRFRTLEGEACEFSASGAEVPPGFRGEGRAMSIRYSARKPSRWVSTHAGTFGNGLNHDVLWRFPAFCAGLIWCLAIFGWLLLR